MAGTLLPDYNVLDAAQPLLTAHRRLPGPIFRAALPVVASLKRAADRFFLMTHRGG
jgi:aarF domain-containing kinase